MRYPKDLSQFIEKNVLETAILELNSDIQLWKVEEKKPFQFFDKKRKSCLYIASRLLTEKRLSKTKFILTYFRFYLFLIADLTKFLFFDKSVILYDFEEIRKTGQSNLVYFTLNKERDYTFYNFSTKKKFKEVSLYRTEQALTNNLKVKVIRYAVEHRTLALLPIAQWLHFNSKLKNIFWDELIVDEGVNAPAFCLFIISKARSCKSSIYYHSPFTRPISLRPDTVYLHSSFLSGLVPDDYKNIEVLNSTKMLKQLTRSKSVENENEFDIGLAVGSEIGQSFDMICQKIILFAQEINKLNKNYRIVLSLHPQYRENPKLSILKGKLLKIGVKYRKENNDLLFLQSVKLLVSERSTLAFSSLLLGKKTILLTKITSDDILNKLKFDFNENLVLETDFCNVVSWLKQNDLNEMD